MALVFGLGAAIGVAGRAHGQPVPAGSVYSRAAGPQAGAAIRQPNDAPPANESLDRAVGAAEEGGRAERVVAAMLAGLERAESISARVRQLARVGDTVLKGGGRYLQSGLGEDQRFRFESRLSADTEDFELLEVCDGLFFWSYRKLGQQPPSVERVDIQRVREHLEKLKAPAQGACSMHLGGVQRTVALLRDWFRFDSITSVSIDDMPVWNVEGHWDRQMLAVILPDRAEAIQSAAGISAAELPDGMPWSVRLSIGKRELFPFRIEWLAIPGARPVAGATPEVVAVLELYDVRIGEPIDATAFVYKPATEGLIDTTEAHLQGIRPQRP